MRGLWLCVPASRRVCLSRLGSRGHLGRAIRRREHAAARWPDVLRDDDAAVVPAAGAVVVAAVTVGLTLAADLERRRVAGRVHEALALARVGVEALGVAGGRGRIAGERLELAAEGVRRRLVADGRGVADRRR